MQQCKSHSEYHQCQAQREHPNTRKCNDRATDKVTITGAHTRNGEKGVITRVHKGNGEKKRPSANRFRDTAAVVVGDRVMATRNP